MTTMEETKVTTQVYRVYISDLKTLLETGSSFVG